MKPVIRNFLLLALMVAASGLAIAMRPSDKLADTRPQTALEKVIPEQFGAWRSLPANTTQIVDPQQLEFVNQIYKQTLTRTYINDQGQHVMLSVAYVEDQSDSFGVHLPEVCYPAQGFLISDQKSGTIPDIAPALPIKQLVATQGNRIEPITYWSVIGNKVANGGTDRKLAQMRYAFSGYIPDGMLVRISSVEKQPASAYTVHMHFARDLQAALPEDFRVRLYGETLAQ